VLTLWAGVVAQRQGFDSDEALTLGRAVAGLNAQSKGRKLGIFHPKEDREEKERPRRPSGVILVEVLGRSVPARETEEGVRALSGERTIRPESVRRYLEGAFGDNLARVRKALEKLAEAYSPEELAGKAYKLYEQFRPSVPGGVQGWGAAGELDLGLINRLTRSARRRAPATTPSPPRRGRTRPSS
jgi:hypothetical protein